MIVTVELAASVVKAPLDLVVAPMDVPSIAPPVMATLLAERLLAVIEPLMPTVSVEEPIVIVSGLVLSVAMLIVSAEERLPILILPLPEVPVPALILTEPPVDEAAVVLPALKFSAPPLAAEVELAGRMVKLDPPLIVVMSAVWFPASESTPFSAILTVCDPPDSILKAVLVAALVSLMMKAGAVPALVSVNDVAVPVSVDAS